MKISGLSDKNGARDMHLKLTFAVTPLTVRFRKRHHKPISLCEIGLFQTVTGDFRSF